MWEKTQINIYIYIYMYIVTHISIGYMLFSIITLVYVRHFAWYLVSNMSYIVLVECGRKIKNSWLNPFFFNKVKNYPMQKCWIHDTFFQSKICVLKDFEYSNFQLYWNVISDQSQKHTIFYKRGFNHEFLIFLPHSTKTTLQDITYQISGKIACIN